MKNISRYFLLSAFLFSGCESDTQHAGIEGTGDRVELASAYGTVSGFGSIYVNGVHFDTDTAEVEIAGEAASEEALVVGMVVDVVGEIGASGKTGVAHTIHAQRVLRGVIESVNEIGSGRKAIHVLGQVVYVNEDATFAGTTFAELAPGVGVDVSGFVTDNGLITATYIAQQDLDISLDALEVEGYINTVDEAAETFTLKNLTVEIAGARFVGGTARDLAMGRRVHVLGTLAEDGKTLQATHIRLIGKAIENGRSVSLEGVIRNLLAGEEFTLQGVRVDIRTARIENGTPNEIETGAQVVAFGSLVDGVLKAERIRIKPLNTERFRGAVTNIDLVNKTFILRDQAFLVTRYTQFKDESRSMDRHFNLENLRSGEEVEVFAVTVGDVLQVTRITRRDQDAGGPRESLRGAVSQLSDDRSFYIGDVFVDATEAPEHEWTALRNREGEAIEVDVEGSYIGEAQFRATHVHIRPGPPCHPHVFFECNQPKPQPPHEQ